MQGFAVELLHGALRIAADSKCQLPVGEQDAAFNSEAWSNRDADTHLAPRRRADAGFHVE
jgi:hypothetical protein